MANENNEKPVKNWFTTLILCWILGFFGVHCFYAGRISEGFLMLFGTIVSIVVTYLNTWLGLACFVTMGAVVVYDFIIIALKKFKDCYGREIAEEKIGA